MSPDLWITIGLTLLLVGVIITAHFQYYLKIHLPFKKKKEIRGFFLEPNDIKTNTNPEKRRIATKDVTCGSCGEKVKEFPPAAQIDALIPVTDSLSVPVSIVICTECVIRAA